MVKVYLDQQRRFIEEEAGKKLQKEQANLVSVLIAKKDIPQGFTINADVLEVSIIPSQFVQPQAAVSLDRITGMITIAPIFKNEQIVLSKLKWPARQETVKSSLATGTPLGKRAVTISVDNIATLAGMIRPRDYVDVIVMLPVPMKTAEGKETTQLMAMPLFQNVLVLAVGQETSTISGQEQEGRYKKEEKRETVSFLLITLALTPQEANLITFVQEQGKIRLILRPFADSQLQAIQPVSWETLFQYLMPQEAVKQPPKEENEPTEYVEIYRGLGKERVPLSK